MTAPNNRERILPRLIEDEMNAAMAGFESSELTLRVTGEAGETLAEAYFPDTEQGGDPEASLLVLEGSAPKILVGYGDGLWQVTFP